MTVSDELKAKREALIRAHIDGETNMDAGAVLATLSEDATYELPTLGRVFRGHAEIRTFLEAVFEVLPGTVHQADRIYHADDAVIVETLTEVPGLPELFRGIAIFPFDGERSMGERLFADMSPIVARLDFIAANEDHG